MIGKIVLINALRSQDVYGFFVVIGDNIEIKKEVEPLNCFLNDLCLHIVEHHFHM